MRALKKTKGGEQRSLEKKKEHLKSKPIQGN